MRKVRSLSERAARVIAAAGISRTVDDYTQKQKWTVALGRRDFVTRL